MKVLQINSVCGSGSTGRLAVQISDYLNQNNIENYIAYGFGSSERANTFRFGNNLDAHFHSFCSRNFALQGKMSKLTTHRLIQHMKHIQPDIVHLHNIHGHYLNYEILFRYLKKTNCEVVWTFHDCWPITGKCVHFTAAKCEKWKTQCFSCTQLEKYPDSKRDRSKKAYSEKKKAFTSLGERLHIVTVSNWLRSVTEKSFLKEHDICCIHNGIDVDKFCYRDSDLRQSMGFQNKFVILSVAGVWNESKGLSKYVELANRLGQDYQIVLVGLKKNQHQNLPDNIIGVTAIYDQENLAKFYSMADVYINFSIEETFGLVVAESMACGTPAIVMNSTACPEVVDENTGFVVEPGDMDAVVNAISTIRERGKSFYATRCRERILSHFKIEKMQKMYMDMYTTIGDR